jgi:hypothetical protein
LREVVHRQKDVPTVSRIAHTGGSNECRATIN